MALNFIDSIPDSSPASLARVVGDAENALQYLREAWGEAKKGENPRQSILEAAERFDGVSRALGFVLFTKSAK